MNQHLFRLLIISFSFGIVLTGICQVSIEAQSPTQKPGTSNRAEPSNATEPLPDEVELERQQRFRSPFRYLIISSITHEDLGLEIPQRRLTILMDAKAFCERNLKILFRLLEKRFPQPVRLSIEVHTNLATLETPEESEMISTHTSRESYLQYYKTALHI